MSTVASRTFKSTPERDAGRTWTAIVDLLTHGKASDARTELLAVAGVAASIIADQAPKEAAITVTCDGPPDELPTVSQRKRGRREGARRVGGDGVG